MSLLPVESAPCLAVPGDGVKRISPEDDLSSGGEKCPQGLQPSDGPLVLATKHQHASEQLERRGILVPETCDDEIAVREDVGLRRMNVPHGRRNRLLHGVVRGAGFAHEVTGRDTKTISQQCGSRLSDMQDMSHAVDQDRRDTKLLARLGNRTRPYAGPDRRSRSPARVISAQGND